MLFKPEYDENGKKVLCEMNGINSEMLMDIYVKKLKKGETLEIIEENNECAILLLSGDVTFKVGNEIDERCKRKNPFEKKPYAVHFCKQVKASVTANEESEILVQMTDNEKTWKSEFYNPITAFTKNSVKANGTVQATELYQLCLTLIMLRNQIWLWAKCLTNRAVGQAIRRTIIHSRSFTITNLTTLKDSVQALRATLLTKQKTVLAFA